MENPMKRSRAPNWDGTEKNLLKEIIKDYASIIECKRTDTNTNKSKIAAWNTVYKRFTELNQRERCLAELKQQWRCIELEAKRVVSEHRRAVSQTGGGPKPPSPSKEVIDIVEMIPLEFQEDTNEFDSNGTFSQVVVDWEEDPSHAPDLPGDEETQEGACEVTLEKNTPSTSSIGKETPSPVEHEERCKRKRQLPKESEGYKLSIKQIAEERSATFIKQQEEQHLLKMRNLEEEIEMRRKEHQMRMTTLEEERELMKKRAHYKNGDSPIEEKRLLNKL